MRVLYELDTDDIKKIIAEKYGVDTSKVCFLNSLAVDARIDMSTYELAELKHDKTTEPDEAAGQQDKKTDADISDTELAGYIADDVKISDICKRYGLDKRACNRLYARAKKLRSECASFTDGRHSNPQTD